MNTDVLEETTSEILRDAKGNFYRMLVDQVRGRLSELPKEEGRLFIKRRPSLNWYADNSGVRITVAVLVGEQQMGDGDRDVHRDHDVLLDLAEVLRDVGYDVQEQLNRGRICGLKVCWVLDPYLN